ncbi:MULTISPECIES: DUF881 domain-containing protein [Nocardioides]|uniref:DUF881 domain-containing protein n=1 Tax=Nocardioides TaxID=1839 RepID=UPI0009FD418C|nr:MULTISPECIES: DUF881 domain-containing protein [Nocardioides]
MAPDSDSHPTHGSGGTHQRSRSAWAWRIGTPVMVLLSGVLFAISAEHSGGTDLRGGRYTDFASVVKVQREDTNELTAEVSRLGSEIERLSAGLGDRSVNRAQREVETLSDPAGLTPRTGPAVKVTLDDAPEEILADESRDPLDVIVHQQDIQAVVNAMWRAGAEAVTIQGQRLITTTGIKCDGNLVSLQGVPYYPPYEIVGIGLPALMLDSLDGDNYLDIYREAAADPRGGVSYAAEVVPHAIAPGYQGLLDLTYATPLPTTS